MEELENGFTSSEFPPPSTPADASLPLSARLCHRGKQIIDNEMAPPNVKRDKPTKTKTTYLVRFFPTGD